MWPDTVPTDWVAGTGIDIFLPSLFPQAVQDSVDSVITYTPFLSLDGLRITLPYGDGMGIPAERMQFSYDLPFWIILICLSVVAMLRFAFPRRMKQLIYSLAGERFFHTLMREGNLFEERISLGLTLVFAATTSLLIKALAETYTSLQIPWAPEWLIWFLLTLAVLFWWSFRALFIRLLGDVFGTQEATVAYLIRNLTYTLIQGIFLCLALPLHYYSGIPWILSGIVLILLLLHAYRIVRNIISGISDTGYGLGYQLLFVFSIEILPLLILARILIGVV